MAPLTTLLLLTMLPSGAYHDEFSGPLMYFAFAVWSVTLYFCVILVRKKKSVLFPGAGALGLFISSLAVMAGVSMVRAGADQWTVYFLCIALGSLLVFNLVQNGVLNFDQLATSLTIVFFVEIAIVLLQASGILVSGSPYFKIAGTYANPNITGMYLAASCPFALYRTGRPGVHGIFSLAVLALAACGLYLLGTRTAMLGLTAIVLYSLSIPVRRGHRPGLSHYIGPLVLILCLLAGFRSVNAVKAHSSGSRLLIWKLTAGIIARQPGWGSGAGSYEREICRELSRYFMANPEARERDNFRVPMIAAYNDYLQLTAEGGLAGLCVIMAIAFLLFKKGRQDSREETTLKACALAVLVMSMTNSFVYVMPNGFLLTLALPFFSSRVVGLAGYPGASVILKSVLILLCFAGLIYIARLNSALRTLKRSESLIEQKEYGKALSVLKPFRRLLRNEGRYWKTVGEAFYRKDRLPHARRAYARLRDLTYEPGAFVMLSRIDWKTGHLRAATDHLSTASAIAPGKLAYKFELFDLYRMAGDTARAVVYARMVSDHAGTGALDVEKFKKITGDYLTSLNKNNR